MRAGEEQVRPAAGPIELRALILAGGPGSAVCPLANARSPHEFPMADGRTALDHALDCLASQGIRDVAVLQSQDPTTGRRTFVNAVSTNTVNLVELVDDGLRGTAGAMVAARSFVGNAPFLVIAVPVWLNGIDLRAIAREHVDWKAAATVVATTPTTGQLGQDSIALETDGGSVRRLMSCGHKTAITGLLPVGLYVFDPRVLDEIDADGYTDIKELLLPALLARGAQVRVHQISSPPPRLDDISEYFRLNHQLLLAESVGGSNPGHDRGNGISVGSGSVVSDRARIVGPVRIGRGCTIEPGATIIGPALVCDGTHVGRGACVRESYIWEAVRLGARSSVTSSIIAQDCNIAAGDSFSDAILLGGDTLGRLPAINDGTPRPHRPIVLTASGRQLWRSGATSYEIVKRALDIIVSGTILLLLSPLLLLLAAAIKLDSRGPVFFRQRRCGRGKREFQMIKFRTMVADAEELKEALRAHNEVEGPMFKIARDPRVTRVGRFLRQTSLDELPQLLNVLSGSMTLVGPRPLAIEEMAWSPKWRDLRLTVRPGITGAWQVSARNDPGFRPWLLHDIGYVKTRSFRRDLEILLKTVLVFLTKAGAGA
jgi:lipopolysaccharide/colanic/teichoic acid biosynthesis glycosyltransferase/dTDP-glucose pyrophosphorylase